MVNMEKHSLHGIEARHHDIAGAHSWMSEICGPHHLSISRPRDVRFRHAGRRLHTITLGVIEYGTDAVIGIGGDRTLKSYSLSLPFCGEQELNAGGIRVQSTPEKGVIVSPTGEQQLIIGGSCRKLQVAIPVDAINRVLESVIKRPVTAPVMFEPSMDAIEGRSGSWWRMVRHTFSELETYEGLHCHKAVADSYTDLIVRTLLLTQANNYSDEITMAFEPKLPSYLMRAKVFIEEHARFCIELQDVEAASGVSRYKLFESFRKYLNVAPMAYLKQYRLLGARREIIEDGGFRNIAEVATSWGFTHLGRFSSDYKKMFSETPSQTLNRRANQNR